MQHRKRLFTAREAAAYLGISLATLSRMDKDGHLMPFRTPGGHRRYSLTMLDEYLEESRRHPLAVTSSADQSRSVAEGTLVVDG